MTNSRKPTQNEFNAVLGFNFVWSFACILFFSNFLKGFLWVLRVHVCVRVWFFSVIFFTVFPLFYFFLF